MNDEELIEDFLNGNKDAFEPLFNRYHRDLFCLINSYFNNTEEARDVTQETFIKAFNNIKKLRDKTKFKAWLFSIGMNLAKDRIKSHKLNKNHELESVSDPTDIENSVIRINLSKVLEIGIQNLPEKQSDVLRLRIVDEMSFKDIAEIMQISETTARTNFHFAIKNLRRYLCGEGKQK